MSAVRSSSQLHQSVLDGVVDHLGVVASAARTSVDPAAIIRRRKRLEDRFDRAHMIPLAAGHQAVAVVEPPHTARSSHIDEADVGLREHRSTALRVLEVRIATIDDDITRFEPALEFLDDPLGRIAARNHQPYDARSLEPLHQAGNRGGGNHAGLISQLLPDVLVGIMSNDLDAGTAQAPNHIASHLAEANHSKFHESATSVSGLHYTEPC
jgi:hypothetical protein